MHLSSLCVFLRQKVLDPQDAGTSDEVELASASLGGVKESLTEAFCTVAGRGRQGIFEETRSARS